MAPDTLSPSVLNDAPMEADGFVVVSVWTPGRYNSTRHTYDHFNTLGEAIAHHNAIRDGKYANYECNGIFAARNGMPVGGALDLQTMQSVEPAPWRRLFGAEKSSPENRMLKEDSLRMRGVPADLPANSPNCMPSGRA